MNHLSSFMITGTISQIEVKPYNESFICNGVLQHEVSWTDRQGNTQSKTHFIPFEMWGKQANELGRYMPGAEVTLKGTIKGKAKESNGKTWHNVALNVNEYAASGTKSTNTESIGGTDEIPF